VTRDSPKIICVQEGEFVSSSCIMNGIDPSLERAGRLESLKNAIMNIVSRYEEIK